jgi:membrane fusion protein (multidrug efflux system)
MSKTLSTDIERLPHAAPARAPRRSRGPGTQRLLLAGLGIVALAVAIFYGQRHLAFALSHEETDDAQVDGDISPVLPRVGGYVSRVLVHDNQHVQAGQPLIEIDPRELDLKVLEAQAALESAQAALTNARAVLANAEAALGVAQAQADVAAVRQSKAADDFRRDSALFRGHAITDRQLSDSRAAAATSQAEQAAASKQVAAAKTQAGIAQSQIASAQANVAARQSDLDFARLQRSYATVTAPMSGVVTRKSVEPGELLEAGQTILSVTSDTGIWVVANYKETQLAHMHVGQPVELTVDAYKGSTFQGRVDSISGATGARFALLPPDNASGNFVKVTQRIPVKIALTGGTDGRILRPGMSVDAAVRIKE